jgi:hypothetical protein
MGLGFRNPKPTHQTKMDSILQMHGNSIMKLYHNMISQPNNKTPKRGNETLLQHCNPLQNELKIV